MNKSPQAHSFRLLATLALALVLGSCSTPQQRHTTKIDLIANTGSAERKSKSLASALATAEKALNAGINTPDQRALYNQAIEDVVTLWLATEKKGIHQKQLDARNTTSSYQLHASWPKTLRFDKLILAREIKHKDLRQDISREGVGVPYIANWASTPQREKENPFMSAKGYFASLTATLDFKRSPSGQNIASLVLHNSNITKNVNLHQHNHQLAFDQSALLEHILSLGSNYSSLGALLSPHKYLEQIGLKTISPPNPNKTPIIMVHGLASDPRTWQNVYNELRSDPVIRNRCQIYFFRYPSGVPVLYSAAKLREKLALLDKELLKNGHNRYANQMMLIGHSMGGLVTKTQVQDSGDTMWLHFLDKTNNTVKLNENQLADLQKYIQFKPNPHISRVVFIATPHRGSELADYWIVKQLRKLIEAPVTIIRAPLVALDQGRTDKMANDAVDKLFESGIPTSMENLSPESDYVKRTIDLPLRKGLKVHSIVGNLKGLELTDPKCSDGVVPYSSAHLKDIKSELVVPYGHSAHEHPMAIKEIHRIIRLHLKEIK